VYSIHLFTIGQPGWLFGVSPLSLAAFATVFHKGELDPMVTAEKSNHKMPKKDKDKEIAALRGGKAKEKAAEASVFEELLDGNNNLKSALQQIEKQFGEGSIMPLGADKQVKIEGIPTGSLSLDLALGGQGLPRGRIIEVFGPESSGKTTLALHTVAQSQKMGGVAAFIDAEHAFDPLWAKKLGVQLDTLLVSQPTSGEEAMQITEMLVKSNAVDIIVIDSVAALVPKAELEGEIGDSHVGLQARLMSQSMRKLTGAIAKSKTVVVFINQIREKIGVMFGSPETTPGGRALKFYCSCRIDVRRIGQLKDGEEVVGQRVRTKVVKNKVAPPFRVAEFDMMHTGGISYEGDILDLGMNAKVVQRSGAWFKYGDVYLGQGKEKARQFLVENPNITQELRDKIMANGADLATSSDGGGE
jgi:recombination protein RecA